MYIASLSLSLKRSSTKLMKNFAKCRRSPMGALRYYRSSKLGFE